MSVIKYRCRLKNGDKIDNGRLPFQSPLRMNSLLSSDVKYRPLQLFLYNTITQADFIRNSAASSNVPPQDVPLESMKMATAVVAIGPVIVFYPFVQKYFIKGITVGAVKG